MNEDNPQIVGIGASAGGVSALQQLFAALPADTGAAFVVVMHLDPLARSEMVAILAARTKMLVAEIADRTALRGNHVYVIPPNHGLQIADHKIAARPFEAPRGHRTPIDGFFQSLASQHADAIAIVLTGAGADGSLGVLAIKEAGGIVLVQDPREAEFDSMPRNAIATEVADIILPIRDLAERLVELLKRREQVLPALAQAAQEDDLMRILAFVRSRTGHDFGQYKRATVLRRIARRLQMTRSDSLADYLVHLHENVEEAQALFGDFLISVTSFFRDPKAFATLERTVIPALFDAKDAGSSLRIWAAGCATGEEAYTLGILLLEEAARRDMRPEIQVFGSDLDTAALATAREGLYPATIEMDLTEERLRRFFIREGNHYRVRRELRDIALFASHSVLKDPPFSRIDLVCCRNLLIYLDRDLQQQACATFHYALNPGGFLFLGSSENADTPSGIFRPIDHDARIYRSILLTGERRLSMPGLVSRHIAPDPSLLPPRSTPQASSFSDAAVHRQMLETIAPPSILVDAGHRAVHLSDSVGRFLQPSGGTLTTDVADLIRPELRFELRAGLIRAFEQRKATLSTPILARHEGELRRLYLQVKPILEGDDPVRHAIVLIIEGDTIDQLSPEGGAPDQPLTDDVVQRIQQELQLAQLRLRTSREESEAINEELRAANEELQSINEEYHSTAEELETSKEELQSINEELQTVNSELKLKLETVSRAHSDLQNLMAATDFGTLFLDTALRIKRFTPRLTDLFNVTVNDEGRPITDFTHALDFDDMADQARLVLRDLAPIEREIQDFKGGWYLVRMRPYRTIENKIDGVVATFVDISERRRMEEALRQSNERLGQEMRLVELSRSPIFVWDFDDGITQWNRGSEELYGYGRDEALGAHKEVLLQSVVPGSSFAELKRTLIAAGSWRGEVVHRARDGREVIVESEIELLTIGERRLVLESTRDITDRKRWEERQQLLLNELTHRVKNTLAVVQAMARQTLRNTPGPEAFVERFEGRLAALAGSHKLLVESNWQGAELGALARGQLQPYIGGEQKRIRMSGQPVLLPATLATPFGLVLHELATNAAKYGSLSVQRGFVSLDWSADQNQDGVTRLNVVWREVDGPQVARPDRAGFGTTLIKRSLPGARVSHEFLDDGVLCTIELDLQAPVAGLDA